MTVYYTLTYILLVSEMATLCVLIAPLPFTGRKCLLHYLGGSWIARTLAPPLYIASISVSILFIDAIQRMWKVTAEVELAKSSKTAMHGVAPETASSLAATKFYAQRNTYLTGFCLFLSIVLARILSISLDLKQNAAASSTQLGQTKELEGESKGGKGGVKEVVSSNAKHDVPATKYNSVSGANSGKTRG